MRCYNCGWNNLDNVTKYQKCNQDLLPDSSFSTPSTEPAVPVQNAFSKTVLDSRASGKSPASQSYSGKLKQTIREFSPEIIHSTVAEEVINKTAPVQDIDTPSARLVPMDNFDGRSSRDVEIRGNMAMISPSEAIDGLSFGTEVKLEFNFSDGCWTLVSDDKEKTVFVSTSNPVKIGKGDIIVIDNRRFRFE